MPIKYLNAEIKKCRQCGKLETKWKRKRVYKDERHKSRGYYYTTTLNDYCSIECKRKYYAEKYGRVPLTKRNRDKILRRDGYKCRYCGDRATDIDHVFPYSKGGMDTDGNLVASCKTCNSTARDKMFDSFNAKREWLLKVQRIKSPRDDWHSWVYGGMKSLKSRRTY